MKECSCESCKGACNYRPGWFKPNEVKAAANLLKMSERKFFKKFLAVDWFEDGDDGKEVFLIAPAIKGEETGTEYPGDPRGECIFLEKGLCKIHKAKPFECRELYHTDKKEDASKRHEAVAQQWKDSQKKIRVLLGRKPRAVEFEGGGLFGMFGL